MSEETAKKLAMEVRQSKESEQFDLAGYGPNSVAKMVQDAFTNPLPLGSMVRLSFVVGGGKKVRQKYNDGLVRELYTRLPEGRKDWAASARRLPAVLPAVLPA